MNQVEFVIDKHMTLVMTLLVFCTFWLWAYARCKEGKKHVAYAVDKVLGRE